VEPDRWIIRGNHHDAWVFGASDPLSGTVALMSEAKAIGRLVKAGWRPRRTLIYASWDGEEPGLIGSTEWAEAHAAELQAKAALYVNSDNNSRGSLRRRRHACAAAFRQRSCARRQGSGDRCERAQRARPRAACRLRGRTHGDPSGRAVGAGGGDLQLGALGSGSDYTPFLQHLGISSWTSRSAANRLRRLSLGLRFLRSLSPLRRSAIRLRSGARQGCGPHGAARRAGRSAAARAADFARSIAAFDEELHQTADRMRTKTRDLDALLDAGVFALAADVREARAAPQRSSDVPYLDFAPLDNAVERLKASARHSIRPMRAHAGAAMRGRRERERINAMLTILEETLTDARGLPGRPWYKHMIYAPGQHTGYEAKTLPGIREAIEERRWEEADQYMGWSRDALNAYSAQLERVIASL
jgi:N-acetylated-alpha-linked acidic dipeptidase